MQTQIVLGTEYDNQLQKTLREVLAELGAETMQSSWGVGGSQELRILSVRVDGQPVEIEAETYIGLSISGEADLVQRIADLVRERSITPRPALAWWQRWFRRSQ